MVVPEIKEIVNEDANALVCKILPKLSSAYCKKVYRSKIGLTSFELAKTLRYFNLLIWLLQGNATEEEFEIYNCWYKNRY